MNKILAIVIKQQSTVKNSQISREHDSPLFTDKNVVTLSHIVLYLS